MKLIYKLDWGPLATFVPNKREPVYNWFYFKEGFARELVFKLLELFDVSSGDWVLDPFCGCGTSLVACKQRSINSIGYDVLPCAVFASKVKTANYDEVELKEAMNKLMAERWVRLSIPDTPPIMTKVFSKAALLDVIFFKQKILELDFEPVIRNFLLMGLIRAAMKISWAWKDGGVIKVRKHPAPPLRVMLRRLLQRMIKEIRSFKTGKAQVRVECADARRLGIDHSMIDAVITSPPYLNQIDYTKVYAIENWLVQDVLGAPEPGLRSYIGLGKEVAFLEEYKLPSQARAYFYDLDFVLRELWRVCKPGARAGIVIGNAWFPPPHAPVECDVMLAELAKRIGFTVDRIMVLNQRAALRRRTEKVGLLRESLVILEK